MAMNLKDKYTSTALSTVWLFAALLLGMTTSCKEDDDPDIDKYIVTNKPTSVGLTYAELSGEFYPDRVPTYLNTHGYEMQPGIELSLSENFPKDQSLSSNIYEFENTHMIATAYGLLPNTQYFYRMYVEIGEMRYYAEKQTFTTLPVNLPCSVGDATNISFDSAEVPITFTQQPPTSPMEYLSYGVAWSTDKDVFAKTKNLMKEDGQPVEDIHAISLPFGDMNTYVTVENLESNTTYYYCAYIAAGAIGVCQFGPVKSFTTGNRDGLMTVDDVSPKFVLAEISGTTKIADSMPGLKYKLMYERANSEWPARDQVDMSVSGNKLSAVVQGLYPNTAYRCWIVAMKGEKTVAESEVKEFATRNPSDDIKIGDATNVTSTTATISCVLLGEGYATEQFCHIYYGEDKNNLLNLTTASKEKDGDKMSVTLTGLKPNTTYYYCGSAICILSFGWGEWYKSEIKSFKTE